MNIGQFAGDVGGIITLSGVAAFVRTVIYDQFHDHPNRTLASFVTGLWNMTRIAFWIAVGVPTAVVTLLICFVWPPMLLVIGAGIYLTIMWKLRHVPMPARTANSDFVTPLLIGLVIGSSIHHDQ